MLLVTIMIPLLTSPVVVSSWRPVVADQQRVEAVIVEVEVQTHVGSLAPCKGPGLAQHLGIVTT